MKKLFVLLVLLVLVLVLGYFLRNRPDSGPSPAVVPLADAVPEVAGAAASPAAAPVEEGDAAELPVSDGSEDVSPDGAVAEQALELTCYGVVEDATTNTPIPNARVTLLLREEEQAETLTGPEGEYRISATVTAWTPRRLRIVCEVEEFARTVKAVPDLEVGETVHEARIDFLLTTGARLSGRVYEQETGASLPGIHLVLAPRMRFDALMRDAMEQNRQETESDAEGRYAFTTVPPGDYHLVASGVEQNLVPADAELKVLRLAAGVGEERDVPMLPGALLHGRVTLPDGALPEAEAQVSFQAVAQFDFADLGQNLTQLNQRPPVRTEDGLYEHGGLRFDTPYRGTARLEGFPPITSEPFTVSHGQSPYRLDFQLQPGAAVQGLVQFQDGSPAPSVRVDLMPDMSEVLSGNFSQHSDHATTDAQGKFTLSGVPAGQFTVMAGMGPMGGFPFGGGENRVVVESDGAHDITDLVLVMEQRQASQEQHLEITGYVITAENTPVPGAQVHAEAGFGQARRASTDNEGAFRISRLRDGVYTVRATHKLGEARQEQVAAGAEVTLTLQGVTRVSGMVVDQEGEPVRQCRVRLEQHRKSDSPFGFDPGMFEDLMNRGENTTQTNEFGFFEFLHVKPADYQVKAVAQGRGNGTSAVFTVAANTQTDNLKVTLEEGIRFSGSVLDATNRPIENARVMLSATGGGNLMQEQMSRFMPAEMQDMAAEAFSDAEGAFAMEGVPAGTYRLIASRTGYARTAVNDLVLEAGRDRTGYTIRLTQGGCVSGTPWMDGGPKPGLMVMAMGDGGMQQTTTDADGHFEICGLAPGTYMIQVMDMGAMMSGDMQGMMPMQRSAEVYDGQITEVDFAPPAGAVAVEGSIRGLGEGMTTVSLRRPGSIRPQDIDPFDLTQQMALLEDMGGTAMVRPDGTFSLPNVVPGEYILEVYTVNFDPAAPDLSAIMENQYEPVLQQEITIAPGEQPPISLDLP